MRQDRSYARLLNRSHFSAGCGTVSRTLPLAVSPPISQSCHAPSLSRIAPRLVLAILNVTVPFFALVLCGYLAAHRAAGSATDDLDAQVVVLGVTDAKGLEFDSVLVVDPAGILAESPRGASDLYVALTRATQRLGVVHTGDLPDVLAAGLYLRDRADVDASRIGVWVRVLPFGEAGDPCDDEHGDDDPAQDPEHPGLDGVAGHGRHHARSSRGANRHR